MAAKPDVARGELSIDDLKRQLEEAQQHQAATSELLKVIGQTTFDLQPVFQTLAENAVRLCEAKRSFIFRFDGQYLRVVATHNASAEIRAFVERNPIAPGRASATARAALYRRTIHVLDAQNDPEYTYGSRQVDPFRTILTVPILKADELLGVILVYRHEVRPFTDSQIALLETFADQAVVAIENSRLLGELRESESRHALVSDAVAEGIYEWNIEMNALWVSQRLIEIFGFEGRELKAADWNELVHSEDFPGYRSAVRDCLKGASRRLDYEYRVRHADGAYRWVEDRAVPVLDKTGRAIRLVGAVSDVTARKVSEQALREALERQTATAEVLEVINASPGNLQPVFDAIVDKAMTLCGAAFGIFGTFDGQHLQTVATRGVPEAFVQFRRSNPPEYGPGTGPARLIAGEAYVHDIDVADSEAYRRGDPNRRAIVDLGGARTILSVALRKDHVLLGTLSIYRQEVRPFGDNQIALLQGFAAQAVIAMENARLINETREALEQQTATSEVLRVVSGSATDVQPVFEAIIARAAKLCEAEFSAVARFDNDLLHLVAVSNLSPDEARAFHSLFPRPPSRGFVMGRAFVEARTVHIEDVLADPDYDPHTREVLQALTGYRTSLGVPILRDGRPIGVITCARRGVRPFTPTQIALVSTFADQALIAIENARLFTEQREALEQQTATAEVLEVINSSPGNLAPVFDAMLDKALHLCGAAFGILWTFDGEFAHAAAIRGATPAYAQFLTSMPHRPGPNNAHGRLIHGEEFVHVADVADDAAYQSEDPVRRATIELGGARTLLAVALRKESVVLGFFVVYRREVRLFAEKQISLLQNFAAQAVIAIENARLINETREALERQKATSDVLGVISTSPEDLEPVFTSILSNAIRLCGADLGNLFLYEGNAFRAAALLGASQALAEAWRRDPIMSVVEHPHFPLARLGATKEVVLIPDITEQRAHHEHDPRYVNLIDSARARTMLLVPMLKEDNLVGAIVIYAREVRPFDDKQIDLVVNFAKQAVIAIENSRLLTEQREALEQQTATAEVLQVINSSPGDLKPVFDALLDKAMRLCGAAFGLLSTYDGERFHQVALHEAVAKRGRPSRFAKYLATTSDQPGPGSASQRLLHGEQLVHVIDLADEEIYRSGDPYRRALVDIGGARTLLAVPLRKDKALLGVINIYRQEVRAFSDKQIALLENFAAQAVIAMENARLLNEQRESLEQQTATADILRIISQSPTDVQPVLKVVAEAALRFCGAEDVAIGLRDGDFWMDAAHLGPMEAGVGEPIPLNRQSVMGRCILGAETVQVADIEAADRTEFATALELARRFGWRAAAAAPMEREGVAIGAILLRRPVAGAFSEHQLQLLESFAAQAVIALENTRLFTELRESLDQQTATAEVLQVINSSTQRLEPVFEAMLEKATHLCEAAFGILLTYDGARFRHGALRSVPAPYAEFMRDHPPVYGPETAPGQLALGERLVHIIDMTDTDLYRSGDPNRRAIADFAGARTLVAVPLLKDSALLGAIVVFRQEVRPFSDKQIALLEYFAAQAVIAMENARLINETREALEQQTATTEVLQVINSSPRDLAPVFDTMLDKATRLSEAAFGILWTYDGERFQAVAFQNVPPAYVEFLREPQLASPVAPLGRVERGEAFALVSDLAAEEYHERAGLLVRQGLSLGGFRTVLAVPLRKDASLLGAITIYRREVQPFSDKQIALLQAFAAQAVIAMENARLLEELRASLEQQTATSDVLKIISRSSVSLETVLDTLVETVAPLCRADQAFMFRREDESHRLLAACGLSDEAREFFDTHPMAADRSTMSGRVSLERRTVHIFDVLQDAEYSNNEGQKVAGFRTLLGIPLLRENILIGLFIVARTHVEPFLDKEVELATSFADQAVIAIENARLFEELRDRQAELRVTFDNMGDGVAMFDAEPRLAAWNRNFEEIIGLSRARLAERPSYADYLRLLAERGEFGTENVEAELASRLENTDRELRLERTRADGTVIEVRRNAVPGGGFVLIYGDVTEQRRAEAEVRAARDAAEAALERQTATADILKVIASSPTDVQPVLDAVARAAQRFCGAADAVISLREGDEFVRAAHEGSMPSVLGRSPLDRSSISGRSILDGRTIHIPDIGRLDLEDLPTSQTLAVSSGARAALAAPMLREGVAVGCILLRKANAGSFAPTQIELLEAFAAQAVIAIENVRLFTELRDSLERLKAAQANLIQAEKMASLGQLTAGIAHEIKNPLNFVNNFAGLSSELLKELKETVDSLLAEPDKDKRAELQDTMDLLTGNLAKISEHGRRADGIVKSMLSHSRGGRGDWQECNINGLVEEALNLAYHGARAQDKDFNVTLERDFASETKLIEVVPQDVTRVFLNLFGNGFYATRKRQLGGTDADYRPTLTVSTRELGEAVEVRVRDNGTGIQPEVRAKLFQPFFTTKPTGEGTGLGLSISYDIVTQQHGGTIEVESEAGSFSEFTVRLPRRRRAA